MFEKVFHESKVILTEGALVERLKAEFNLEMDKHVNHAGLIYTHPDKLALLYRQYADIAVKHSLPIMLMTPSRKVNVDSVKGSKYELKSLLTDTCSFLKDIQKSYASSPDKIFVGGLVGSKGDAFSSAEALNTEEAYRFHTNQVRIYEENRVDFVFAGIMPEINEALGMAKAIAQTDIPYIISFTIRKDGCLIDGTPIFKAVDIIDNQVSRRPLCYTTNCVHSTNVRLALENEKNKNMPQLLRFKGVQANASSLSPEELNNCGVLKVENFRTNISEMVNLYKHFGFKVFGGCCGTNEIFMKDLAANLVANM